MGKPDAVPLTRSPAELSALNSLRSLSDLVRRPQSNECGRNLVITSSVSVTALRSLCSSQEQRQSTTDHTELGSLERWLALAQVAVKLDDDVKNLKQEIHVHEHRRNVLKTSSSRKLPSAEACELGVKLQCLQEILGTGRFRAYCRDLFVLVRNLRLRVDLYGIRMLDLERHLCQERVVSIEKLLHVLNDVGRCFPSFEEANRHESTTLRLEPAPLIEHEEYALLFQHCSEPGSSEADVVTADFMALLRSLPLERMTVVRYVFEQLTDSRRGEGYRPPPDHTRTHHLQSVIKLQRRHCSTEEVEAVEAWLQVVGSKAVTLQDVLQFHLPISDAKVSEDAEFVRFVQRMWGFNPVAVKDGDRGDAIQSLLDNYLARCNLLELITRKREVIARIPSAQARIRSASARLESELQQLRALQAPATLRRWLQCDESVSSRLGQTLELLRELTLSGQGLTSIPVFVGVLRELQTLDLRDNRLETILSTLSEVKNLQVLNLSNNLLRDASFVGADELWKQLEVLINVDLSGNQLTSLPSALVAIPKLQTLDLSRNALRFIHGEVVTCWKGKSCLRTLDLHCNALTTLPEEIRVLFESLQRLLLHENHLTSLPLAIAELVRLEELLLSQNQLTGDSIASYPVTERHVAISLAQNQLRVFPCLVAVQIEGKRASNTVNTSVKCVDMRGNRLRSISVDWTPITLANCHSLHLQKNDLRELPHGFFTKFPALRVCELQSNQLRLLPVEITHCTRLQILHVHDNCLQVLPKELVRLPCLEVLNAAENELTEIPLEWHEFETQNDGNRVLQSLLLRRNPLRNQILRTIVDGSTDSSVSAIKRRLHSTPDDAACETVLNKLLDGLRDALSGKYTEHRVSTRKAWIDSDEDERPEQQPKWRGVARDVNRYLEQRLRAITRPTASRSSASLIVDVKSFERLIRTLPLTCSKRELAQLVRRFLVSERAEDQETERRARQIDGLAFLQAIEQFGRWRSISMPSKRCLNSVLKPTIDSAAPIIHYLVVLHRRMQQQVEKHEKRAQSPQLKPKVKEKHVKTPRRDTEKDVKRTPRPAVSHGVEQFMKLSKSRVDVLADRQRQRIQVLEQQLVDQKLLLLAHQNGRREDPSGSAIASADLETVSERERQRTIETNSDDDTIVISVKCLQLCGTDESEEIGDQHVPTRRMKDPARLEFAVRPDESVLRLKQQLEARTGVPVEHQILIANSVGHGAPAVRLRNNGKLREYSEQLGAAASRCSLTLLIGQSLPLFSGHSTTL